MFFPRSTIKNGVFLFFFCTGLIAECLAYGPALKSQAFSFKDLPLNKGGRIPLVYTCYGADSSPPLAWDGVPAAARSLILIVEDHDSLITPWVYWVCYNIPSSSKNIPQSIDRTDALPGGGIQGRNGCHRTGYDGPCPADTAHGYLFKLYAVDTLANLPPALFAHEVRAAVAGHLIDSCEFYGAFGRVRSTGSLASLRADATNRKAGHAKNSIDGKKSGLVIIRPQEYPFALRNPLMGFRDGGRRNSRHPFVSLIRRYVKYCDLENSDTDGVDKISAYSTRQWDSLPLRNVKVIPRVYLFWPKDYSLTDGQKFWPADLSPLDYSSPQFQLRLSRFIEKLGKAWDNDPKIAWIEMGLIGQWGEHHSPEPTPEVESLLEKDFSTHFKNKKILIRYPRRHFKGSAFGAYWDSFASGVPVHEEDAVALDQSDRWKRAPIEGEVAPDGLLGQIGENPTFTMKTPRCYLHLINYIRRTHASSLSWSNYDVNDTATHMGADLVQKAFGYRFVIDEASYPDRVWLGKPFSLSFVVRNLGSAPFYEQWPVEVALLDSASRRVVWKDRFVHADIRTFLPGDTWVYGDSRVAGQGYLIPAPVCTLKENFLIPSIIPGRYYVSLAILDPAGMLPSVRFAIKNYFKGGRHPIGWINVNTTGGPHEIDPAAFDDPQSDTTLRYEAGSEVRPIR